MDYLFYDIESTGLHVAFDQPLQFAAILTDADFNEIERYNFSIACRPDVSPSVDAAMVHLIPFQRQGAMPEYEAMIKIHALLNRPNTINLGYNTLSFDDAMLRFGFFRYLLTPYTHQYKNGCRRMDLYPIVVLYALYHPEGTHWPTRDDRLSLKLDDLNQANGWVEGRAHDALIDVQITIALAKHLRETSRDWWHYAVKLFNKSLEQNQLRLCDRALREKDWAGCQRLLVSGRYGAVNQYQRPALYLGVHEHYHNQTAWLFLDADNLADILEKDLTELSGWQLRKPAEALFCLPYTVRVTAKLSAERVQRVSDNLKLLTQSPAICQAWREKVRHFTYPVFDNIDAYSALYTVGFPNKHDKNLMNFFYEQDMMKQVSMASEFNQPVYRTLIERYLGLRFGDALPAALYEQYVLDCAHCRHVPRLDHRGQPALSYQESVLRYQALRSDSTLSAEQSDCLRTYSAYYGADVVTAGE